MHVWTVNTPDELQLCLDLGVKAVITDRPAYMLDLLGVVGSRAMAKSSRTKEP